MLSKANLDILVDSQKIYSTNDRVEGVLVVRAKKNFEVRSINVQLSGTLQIEVIEHETYYEDGQYRTRTIGYREVHPLILQRVELCSNLKVESFVEEETREYGFSFNFPEVVICDNCGKQTQLPPSISLSSYNLIITSTYSLSAVVVPDSKFSVSERKFIPLKFRPKGTAFAWENSHQIVLPETAFWRSKLKKYIDDSYEELYFDDGNKDIKKVSERYITNPLNNSHRKSRGILKFFNRNYKSNIYEKLVGNIKLEMTLSTETSYLGYFEDIPSKFNIKLRTQIDNLIPDFLLYCNKSSQLGAFVITGCAMFITSGFSASAHGHHSNIKTTKQIFKNSLGYNLTFDVIDFIPNIQDPTIREWDIPIKKLFGDQKINLDSILIGPTYKSGCDILSIDHILNLEISVAENLETSPKKFKFSADILL